MLEKGNGPSALFLSFILHGNVPFYDPVTNGPHPDARLHDLLLPYTCADTGSVLPGDDAQSCSLLTAINDATLLDYIRARYISFYSVNTNPVALLIDTLIASDESNFASLSSKQSRILWKKGSESVRHVVFGSSPTPGGQWTSPSLTLLDSSPSTAVKTRRCSNGVCHPAAKNGIYSESGTDSTGDEQSLSYAEMLSLPGYSFTEFYTSRHPDLGDYSRPKRQDIANYYTEYPQKLGLADSFLSSTIVTSVDSTVRDKQTVFVVTYIYLHSPYEEHRLEARTIVLASGVFEKPLKMFRKAVDRLPAPSPSPSPSLLSLGAELSTSRPGTPTAFPPLSLETSNSSSSSNIYIEAFNSTSSPTKLLPARGASREDLEADIRLREPSILVPTCPPRDSPQTVLVIGSGVSAAEAINKCGRHSNVIHAFQWIENDPSPLRRLSSETYPEYASVYKLMKKAVRLQKRALENEQKHVAAEKLAGKPLAPISLCPRAAVEAMKIPYGNHSYIGVANALVQSVSPCGKIVLLLEGTSASPDTPTQTIEWSVSKIKICTGRSGSLEYLGSSARKLAGLRSVNADLGSVSKTFLETHTKCREQGCTPGQGESSDSDEEGSAKKSGETKLLGTDEASAPEEDPGLSISSKELPACCPSSPIAPASMAREVSSPSLTPAASSTQTRPSPATSKLTSSPGSSSKPSYNLKLGDGLYAIGSLTGETLVRFMLGGCLWVGHDLLSRPDLLRD